MSGLGALRRISAPKPAPPAPEEVCELCTVGIGERHGHVADVAQHRLLCVCRPCYLLFAPDGAGGGRYRGVGEQVRRVSDLALDEGRWDALRIPVDVAFFFEQTDAEQVLAFYPGPAGATESLLDLAAWTDVVAENPVLGSVQPDVEAVLLRRHDGGFSCHLAPIDLCYELVGIVRRSWTGLGGGPEVWREIDAYFSVLDRRSVPVHRDGTP
ncbi:DUF5947 family protein [Nocardioides sp. MAHUQ-72]|uniref:DUF5947 family protein n=1 Tax=unclassified Nocardioides TaxID=2615069 RepID=UPI00360E6B18